MASEINRIGNREIAKPTPQKSEPAKTSTEVTPSEDSIVSNIKPKISPEEADQLSKSISNEKSHSAISAHGNMNESRILDLLSED